MSEMDELKETMKTAFDIIADPALADAISRMYWNVFVSMKRCGFTENQAIQLLANFKVGK